MFFRTVSGFMFVVSVSFLTGCGIHYIKSGPVTGADVEKVYASSEREAGAAKNAFDGDPVTRWESEWGKDPSWLAIELKEEKMIEALSLKWEAAAASISSIEVSLDGKSWQKAARIEDGKENEKRMITFAKPAKARYLRIFGEKRTLNEYGYSVWEMELNPVILKAESKLNIKKAEVSSFQKEEGKDFSGALAIDGKADTRWSSEFSDPQWIVLELEKESEIRAVKIKWETAAAKVYKIQVSGDKNTWKEVAVIKDGKPEEERRRAFNPVNAKFVRIYGEERNGEWGYSIWEFEAYK